MVGVNVLVDEATFHYDEKGVTLRSMDPSHVAMVEFEQPRLCFSEYVWEAKKPLEICLNLTEILKVLKNIKEDETLTVEAAEKQLIFTLAGTYVRTFKMPTLEMTEEKAPLPKIDFKTEVKMISGALKQIVEDAGKISDHLVIEATSELLKFSSKGNLSEMTAEIPKDSETLLSLKVQEDSRAVFSLGYLADIVKGGYGASDVVDLSFSTNMPVKLNFGLPESQILSYHLAPRIEPD